MNGDSSDTHSNQWVVHKFGGTSVGDADCFRRVAGLLHAQTAPRQAVVVSAMGGMTNALLALIDCAILSADSIGTRVNAIRQRYLATSNELLNDAASHKHILTHFEDELSDITDILNSIALVGSAAQRSHDIIAGYGEIWSTRLLSAYLEQERDRDSQNRSIVWMDARKLLIVESGELGPAVAWKRSGELVNEHFPKEQAVIVIITGFIASDAEGLQTTLGRNGSDYSASIIGTLLHAAEITIWTDVAGVMSADPNRVPEAAVIHELTYSEAMELAYFGAKVIHPQTMSPAVQQAIPIYIKSTFNPKAAGSKISASADAGQPIKGITTVENVALVNLEGTGMIGVPGTADRLFGALRNAGISVILISQASSEHSICFCVPGDMAAHADTTVREAFASELEQNQIQRIEIRSGCSIIAVVGDGMAGTPGIASRFLGTLGNAGINVRAIAQGSSERNISAVIDSEVATRALRAAHAGFYLSTETLSVGLVGPGNVGSTLLAQMAAQVKHLRDDFNLDFRLRAIASSSRMLLAERSIDLQNWQAELAEQGEELDWDRFNTHVNAEHLPHAAIVDCTASNAVSDRYTDWFNQGIHVVTANKKAQSGPLQYYNELLTSRRSTHSHFLYETSVGAGLPIIQTLRDLKETGDDIAAIEGIFSGTLAYLFNVFDGSTPFSAIVREARDNGYTEPDPRDDLSGMDVARKLIILARELGLKLELEDIAVESLVPVSLEDKSIDDFLDELGSYDNDMLKRYQTASSNNQVLRYVGSLDKNGKATVKLESLPAEHSFAHINLTDNIVRFVSGRYSDNPLVVQGPGAGPAVTAAGVFADLLRLARYLGAPG
ncbi:MAG: bifunctional aspartate kinase/homoserine dehydrogenase I [Gammaproteobacteria bacterium]|nr:bifunctional aspartate kinase/homoserine dehydrogenase I [Gammaproteobacteria bacterium]MCP4091499.1 bifunctional aspartate kinase/homoserine dehydrogenase I [Gammaproteobacteria bacterium]MCP4275409.1 bifunctional aspartate kinase/homoserine dehydrogenase I [Gammaproteobacteria bacterium]MCP4832297.1 bifunctional aspartate kinase/homoserine dehydrogenase I [Gammaproteobacteria bacterium]MCP4928128.1 bifunctional aspartate kinase/homoserine dehydrogenase I [Gammaproteobacteria bacterium]